MSVALTIAAINVPEVILLISVFAALLLTLYFLARRSEARRAKQYEQYVEDVERHRSHVERTESHMSRVESALERIASVLEKDDGQR